ncbi:hypothetical protein [Nocardioides sp. WS12]|uniref:hypothetical protein n=1 Tax=Nocardioides sp. WS12 TaxID=2486272 RepID=UPI0015FC2D6B|nr:hypothetical protein [Nocardioides sp. WS12]
MSTVLRALLLSALLTLVPVGIGVVVADDTTNTPLPPAYKGTDLADFDSSAAVVQRTPFCELLPAEAVKAALGAAGELTSYGNGEESAALPGSDVAHEYGCLFAPAETAGTEARGWVFAPPVSAERASGLISAATTKVCVPQPTAAAYGTPSVAVVCTNGDTRTASFRGLFGDAWLACSLTLPVGVAEADLVARTGRWCVAVAQAASFTTT